MEKMLNCNSKTLEKLFIDSHEWNTVIKNLNHVRVEEKREELELKDFADPRSVWPIIEEAGINVHYDCPVVEQLVSGQNVVSSYPRDLFVAQIEEDSANKMARRNGVVVVSANNPSLEQIKRPVLPFDVIQGTKVSWNDIFMCIKESPRIPLNSLVLIDRYLFVNHDDYNCNTNKKNIIKILTEALPINYSDRFDVLIITSDENLHTGTRASFDDIIMELTETCKELRDYDINLEVLVLINDIFNRGKGDKRIWDESHDRRIITNYYRIVATKGFVAFGGAKTDEVLRTQTITVDCAFSNIDNKYSNLLGFPIKGYDATLTEICHYVSTHKQSSPRYTFYQDGEKRKDLSAFKNRIVLMQK